MIISLMYVMDFGYDNQLKNPQTDKKDNLKITNLYHVWLNTLTVCEGW